MHFVNLCTVLLCRSLFGRIQKAFRDETAYRRLNSHHNLLWKKCRVPKEWWRCFTVQPLNVTLLVFVEGPFFIACHDLRKKGVVGVVRKEGKRHFKTAMFFGQFVRGPIITLLFFTYLMEVVGNYRGCYSQLCRTLVSNSERI